MHLPGLSWYRQPGRHLRHCLFSLGRSPRVHGSISREATEQQMAWVPMRPSAGMTGIDLRQGRYKRDFEITNDARAPSSGMRPEGCESISCQYPIYIAYTSALST